MSQNSSEGPDEFPAILLKQCSKSLAHPLQLLYKASMKTGMGEKQALRSKPSQELPYCSPIESYLINIMEKRLAKNIHQFLETHQKMNPKQHGCCRQQCVAVNETTSSVCTPRISVRAPPILNTNIRYKLRNSELKSIMLCR